MVFCLLFVQIEVPSITINLSALKEFLILNYFLLSRPIQQLCGTAVASHSCTFVFQSALFKEEVGQKSINKRNHKIFDYGNK